MESIPPSDLVILSSVLFLVVIELSKSFEQHDLKEKAANQNFKDDCNLNIGIFSLIHFLNFSILSIGLFLTADAFIKTFEVYLLLLGLIYSVLLTILPFIEISDYEKHVHDNLWSASFKQHTAGAFLIYTAIILYLLAKTSVTLLASEIGSLFALAILGIGMVISPLGFLKVVRNEYGIRYLEEDDEFDI